VHGAGDGVAGAPLDCLQDAAPGATPPAGCTVAIAMTLAHELSVLEGCSLADLTAVADLLPVGLIVLDEQLVVLHRNQAAEGLFGAEEDWVGLWSKRVPAPGGQSWSQVLANALAQNVAAQFAGVRYAAADDEARTLNVGIARLDCGKRRVLAVLVADATYEAELARRLAATENLAAVGRLAARVAHELNNPLDGTLRYVGLALRVLASGEAAGADRDAVVRVEGYLDQVREGLLRMTRIVADLLAFSRNAPAIHENGNINRVVEEALNGLAHLADGNRVAIMADFHDDPQMPAIEGTRLYQVCSNLIRNALDAMPEGGRLTVRTGIVERQVVIRIEDTGAGLPDTVERVFEPFYTTKEAGKGTGLGLAICREYIAQLGGRISADNVPAGGAVFTVRIPVSACKPPVGAH